MGLGITGLAVGRALGRRGLQVIGIGNARHAGAHSRYIRIAPGSDTPHDEAALEHYTDLGRKLDEPGVLLPTGDPNVLFIARHREVLSAYFRFHVADTELLETIASKRRFVALAERLALRSPARSCLPAART